MENGVVNPTTEGTPQGGPLSPLLSNIVLDDLDRELERRGLCFARYADDCNIYVRSQRAAQRVMTGISRFITEKLKLKVNEDKSAVARPWGRKFLAFSFTANKEPKRRLSPQALKRFKKRIREITRCTRTVNVRRMIDDLRRYINGWRGYFGFCQTPSILQHLDQWIRRRLRCVVWRHWKRGRTRYAALRKLGVGRSSAAKTAGSACGPWRISRIPALNQALPMALLASLGLTSLVPTTA